MDWKTLSLLLVIGMFSWGNVALGQHGGGTSPGALPPEGWETGGYRIHQSIELGYRANDVTGSQAMYDTLIDERSGPRIFEQSLSMQSATHESLLFDNLYVNSFGWGGELNNAIRLRLDKSKLYDFRTSYRRDHNFFDYNLLANPLNPSTSTPFVPVTASPHAYDMARRMTDIDLTLLPQSWISFRLGYSHNNMSGPSFSSFHEGADVLLNQPWNTTLNSYRLGVDLRVAPRTVVSYDQFLDYYKGDTNWDLGISTPALLPGGAGTVELGLPIDTVNGAPCRVTAPATTLIDSTGTLTNIACNGYFAYNRSNRVRTSNPTERLSFRSNYFSRLDFTASFAYSDADMSAAYNEFFNGLVTRTFTRQFTANGPPKATRTSDVGDFTATLHLTNAIRIVDIFRFWAYRIPENLLASETDWNLPVTGSCRPPACSLVAPISSVTPVTTETLSAMSFNQNWTRNETDLVWDVNRHLGARAGFRYGSKTFNHILDFTTGDEDKIPVHEYTVLVSFWAKPMANMRFNFDWEHSNYDNTIVRIGPRKEARYRIQGNYTPKPWVVVGASINLWENSNNDALTLYDGHSRNYGVTASLAPKQRFGFDFAYNYNDYQQNAMICFNDTPPAGVTLPVVTGAASCTRTVNPDNPYNDPANPLLTNGFYTNKTHYGMGTVRIKPVARLTTEVGYSITSVGGSTPQFNVLQPLGPLAYNYHQPLAKLDVDLGHNLSWLMGWNYAQYGEKSFIGPTDSRYFHANNATFSLRWGF